MSHAPNQNLQAKAGLSQNIIRYLDQLFDVWVGSALKWPGEHAYFFSAPFVEVQPIQMWLVVVGLGLCDVDFDFLFC